MLDLLAQGIDPAEVSRYPEQLDAASAAEASAAGTSLLIVGNAAEFIDDLRAIRPDVEVIPASELDLASASLR